MNISCGGWWCGACVLDGVFRVEMRVRCSGSRGGGGVACVKCNTPVPKWVVTWRAAKYAEVNKQLLVEGGGECGICVCLGDVFHDEVFVIVL